MGVLIGEFGIIIPEEDDVVVVPGVDVPGVENIFVVVPPLSPPVVDIPPVCNNCNI